MRGNAVMAMLTLAIISVVAALQVFGKDRLVFWRESESGRLCHPSALPQKKSFPPKPGKDVRGGGGGLLAEMTTDNPCNTQKAARSCRPKRCTS